MIIVVVFFGLIALGILADSNSHQHRWEIKSQMTAETGGILGKGECLVVMLQCKDCGEIQFKRYP